MIELTKHIEILLLENDCVIVPELGGFIAYYQPARYEEDEGVFLPPTRMVGFNPQLTMNDGLLAQAYMQTHHTDFLDATKQISVKVNELKETLYNDGLVEIQGIGTLYYTMYGQYEFHPLENGVLAPGLYALDSFSIAPLAAEVVNEAMVQPETPQEHRIVPEKTKKSFTLHSRWFNNAVAVVIAAVLFFALSVPVENTYIDKGNYASLGTDCLFDAIRSQSMATTLTAEAMQQQKTTPVVPVVVKVEKVAPAPAPKVEETPKVAEKPSHAEAPKKKEAPKVETKKATAKSVATSKKKYHLIVASLATSADAERMLKEYKQQGHTGASVIQGGGRYRISLCNFGDKSQAQNKLNELKKADAFKQAWMLTSK